MAKLKLYREDGADFVTLSYQDGKINVAKKPLALKDHHNVAVTSAQLSRGTLYIEGSIRHNGKSIHAFYTSYGKVKKDTEMLSGILYWQSKSKYDYAICYIDIDSVEYSLVAEAFSNAGYPIPTPKLDSIDFFDNSTDEIYALPSNKAKLDMLCPADISKCSMHKFRVGIDESYRKIRYYECPVCKRWYADINELKKANNFCAQNGYDEIEYYSDDYLDRELKYIREHKCHRVIANGMISAIPENYPIHRISFVELKESDALVVSDYNFCTIESHYNEDSACIICAHFERKADTPIIERVLFLKATFCESCQKFFISSDDYKAVANKGRLRVNVIDDNKKFNVTSGPEFVKEEKILLDYESDLERYVKRIKPPIERFYRAVDENDKHNHDIEVKKYKSQFEEMDRVVSFENNPYRFRLVMRNASNHSVMEFLLGIEKIGFDGKEQVQSIWSPIGQIYKKNRETKVKFEGHDYEILLRREVDIQGKRLYGFFDVYNSDDELFQSGITDPFLISVLRKRQTQHQLTDILTTIQKKQNDIIEQPYNKNLVIQGCAGSGKTMVMLHRLSYFVSEEVMFDADTTKIITPNKHFDMHINSLTIDLRISRVSRLTVEEYYAYLISKYDKTYKLPNIQTENIIDSSFLDYIYGDDYSNLSKLKVDDTFHSLYSDIKDEVNSYIEMFGIQSEFVTYDHRNLFEYINYAQKIGNLIKERYQELKNELSTLQRDFELYEIQIEKIRESVNYSSSELDRRIIMQKGIETRIKNNILFSKTEDETQRIEEVIRLLTKTTVISLHRDFITEIYKKQNVKVIGTYRFFLYSLLMFSYLSLGRGMGNDSLLCFDEGQDISANEYKLIFDVNAQETIFNIYGDTNQLIKGEVRGLETWTPLIRKLHAEYFNLNENYRNTNQITRFCNEYFNQSNNCTGIDGEDVERIKEIQLETIINEMSIDEERIAVIYCDRNNEFVFDIDRLTQNKRDLVVNSVESGKICVSNVENVKGIEFDIVFVITKGMTNNEKYIAFTRPLNKLFIVEYPS